MASKAKATDGAAITALQKAQQAIGPMPFSWPAQPSQLSDIGMSVGIGISVAIEVADVEPMSKPANPCKMRPTAKIRAATIADARRILSNLIRSP
jgi:hypothetical protein